VRELSGIAMPLSFLKFSRDAEREADLLGMQYQYSSGYDPTAFVDFFEKLEAEEEGKQNVVSRAFSTHPMNSDRVHRAEQMLELLPGRDTYITNTSEFDEVRSRLANLTQGRVVGGSHKPHPTLRKRRPQ
jgi:predicted Zn-dependent protease